MEPKYTCYPGIRCPVFVGPTVHCWWRQNFGVDPGKPEVGDFWESLSILGHHSLSPNWGREKCQCCLACLDEENKPEKVSKILRGSRDIRVWSLLSYQGKKEMDSLYIFLYGPEHLWCAWTRWTDVPDIFLGPWEWDSVPAHDMAAKHAKIWQKRALSP